MKCGGKNKIIDNKERGFSLMEVLMAIFVLIIVLVGVMALIVSANGSVAVSSAKLVAANLAQEGIEVVKNIRDLNNGANGWNDWYAGFSGTTCYYVQYDSAALNGLNQISCAADAPILKYDSGSGLYGYNFGVNTAFAYKRKITLIKNPSGADDSEIKILADITWSEHGRAQTLTVEDRLWNWR